MEQQGVLIDRLFGRLAARYGSGLARLWEGTNIAQVKAAWAEELGGFTAEHFARALRATETNTFPPNLPEFLSACRIAAKATQTSTALPAPDIDPEVLEERRAALRRFQNTFGKAGA